MKNKEGEALLLKARTGESLDRLVPLRVSRSDRIYFMGICGTAMASLAIYLRGAGFQVLGSDQNIYPPMSDILKRAGIPVCPYGSRRIKSSIRIIIVGNVISKSHPEIQTALKLGIPCLSLPEFLEQAFLSRTKNIVVAGTHGKSTGTALMSHIGEMSGQSPGFFIGAVAKNFPFSFRVSDSSWFVIEGDEYDTAFFAKRPKFFYYRPFAVLLTGIEFDHGDIYKNLDEITGLFCDLVSKIPESGCLAVYSGDKQLEKAVQRSAAPVAAYGIDRGDYTMKNRKAQNGGQSFDICHKGDVYPCSIPLFGEHNALNALGAFALSHQLKWPVRDILRGLRAFKGLKRRLERRGQINGAEIYEDFAHHPTAIRAVLSALKEMYPQKRLLALFEPRSYTSRLNVFQNDYVRAFAPADLIFIAQAYDASKIPKDKRFSSEQLAQDLKRRGQRAFFSSSFEDIKADLMKTLSEGDVAVFMSSGSFGGLLQAMEYD